MIKFIVKLLIVIIVVVGAYFFFFDRSPETENISDTSMVNDNQTETSDEIDETKNQSLVIGRSVGGYEITAYHFGDGENQLLFVGGIHGGYS